MRIANWFNMSPFPQNLQVLSATRTFSGTSSSGDSGTINIQMNFSAIRNLTKYVQFNAQAPGATAARMLVGVIGLNICKLRL